MEHETSAPPDWYADPEVPGALRYWDGSAWTDHRAAPGKKIPKSPVKVAAPPREEKTGEDSGFALIVAGVLGAALLLIAAIASVAIWFDSYGAGRDRGELALNIGITARMADEYCTKTAKDTAKVGSADGSWDTPWIMGCKKALGG